MSEQSIFFSRIMCSDQIRDWDNTRRKCRSVDEIGKKKLSGRRKKKEGGPTGKRRHWKGEWGELSLIFVICLFGWNVSVISTLKTAVANKKKKTTTYIFHFCYLVVRTISAALEISWSSTIMITYNLQDEGRIVNICVDQGHGSFITHCEFFFITFLLVERGSGESMAKWQVETCLLFYFSLQRNFICVNYLHFLRILSFSHFDRFCIKYVFDVMRNCWSPACLWLSKSEQNSPKPQR